MNTGHFPQDFRPPGVKIRGYPWLFWVEIKFIIFLGIIGFFVGGVTSQFRDNGALFGAMYIMIAGIIYIYIRRRDFSVMGIVTYLGAANTSSKDSICYLSITNNDWNFLKDKKGVSLPALKVSFGSDMVEGPPLKEGSKIILKGRWTDKSKPVEAKEIWNLSPKEDTNSPDVIPEVENQTKVHYPEKTPDNFPPELISNYSSIELIGEGGFARVFKATRKKDNTTVAVKIPKLDEKTGRVFLNEVSAWRNLNHENIVKLLDANVHPAAYIETEYIDGTEIKGKRIRDLDLYPKPVEEEEAVRIIRMTAEGLHHAHTKGVIHRDLKPSNVLINSSLTPKISDFGLAKLSADSKYTMLKGYTPLYAAPEQIDHEAYGNIDGKPDKRTDIYQIGVIFYELLTGKLPYEGRTPAEISTKIITPGILPIKPSVHNPSLGKYDPIVMKCLEKKKEDRFSDIGEFLEQLKNVTRNHSSIEQLKKTLYEQKKIDKMSTSSEEIKRSRRMIVETLGKLLVIYAESDNKTELLNNLGDMKSYTFKNLEDLSKAMDHLEFLRKNESRVSEDFISVIQNLVYRIRRENEL